MKVFVLILSLFVCTSAFAQFRKLNGKDPVAKVANHFHQEWSDGNITTGTSQIRAVSVSKTLLNDGQKLEKALLSEMQNNIEKDNGEMSLSLARVKTSTKTFDHDSVVALTHAYTQSNDYAPEYTEGFKFGMASVYAIADKLDATKIDLVVSKVSGVYTGRYPEGDSITRKVSLWLLANSKTGKGALFFLIEGKM